MEALLKSIAEHHDAEVFEMDNVWIVSSENEFWNYYELMEIFDGAGFTVGEGVDLNGEDVLVVSL